jgi:hypothetical protein
LKHNHKSIFTWNHENANRVTIKPTPKLKNMPFKTLSIIGLLFVTGIINAQTDFRPGYVIKANDDTLVGQIDCRSDISMGEICRFKTNNNQIKEYTPDSIKGYRLNDSKYFVSKMVNGKKVFLEFLIKGKINIFYINENEEENYYIEKEGIGISKIPYEEEIRYRKDDSPYYYISKQYARILNYYMQDVPEFQSRIVHMGKPGHQSLIKLAEDYHNKVCTDQSCIIYEKKEPFLKLDLELIAGIVNYQYQPTNEENSILSYNYEGKYTDKNYLQVGVLAHLWIPNSSEKLFLKTGLYRSAIESVNYKGSIYKIPIQIEYIYPKGQIRPKLAYGINIYTPFNQSVITTAGLNIKLYKSLNLGINYDIDFVPNNSVFIFPKRIYSQSFLLGLQTKL